jgi:hypothetical protein
MGKDIPKSSVLGIIPKKIDVKIGVSEIIGKKFDIYIKTLLNILEENNISIYKNSKNISLSDIIKEFKNPKR